MSPPHEVFVRSAHRALRSPVVARGAARLAVARGRQLVLVFHRIVPGEARPGGVVTATGAATFRDQLHVLRSMGDVVPLTAVLDGPGRGRRPRIALTFDDDSTTHHEVVLPILQEFGLPGTFFLSGRSLHGLGPIWFEILDRLLLTRGLDHVVRLLGVSARSASEIAGRCERDAGLRRALVEHGGSSMPAPLGPDGIRALAEAGMTIGFHTLRHRNLTTLPDHDVDRALREGKQELESAVGASVRLFAYPHGAADRRVAERVRHAGYVAAWTGRQRPVTRSGDRYQIGRWEPGPLPARDLRARIVANLNGWAGE